MNGSIRMGVIEMYESPITIEHVPAKTACDDFTNAMAKAGAKKLDEMILKAVGEVKVNVDPDELEKALQYDRDQFQKGFAASVEWAGPKWISVKDRLPEPNTIVLCWREFMNGPIILDYGLICGNMCFYDFDEDGFPEEVKPEEVTHWMPLPEAPKEE
jgi:hypothetical protein